MAMSGRTVTAWALAVTLIVAACEARADPFADEWTEYPAPAPSQARWLLFSNTDIWRQGVFSHGGVLWAPSGLDQQGLVLKLMFGGGVYRYTSGALGNTEVRGGLLAGARRLAQRLAEARGVALGLGPA